MDTKKLFATFAILMLALGIAGFAYAHWTKIVTVDGEITTGILDLIIVPGSPSDTDNGIDPGKDKDVADTTIIIDPNDPERAIITITNAYPCYEVYWHVTIRNVGTIPAKLKDIIITAPNCITVTAWDGVGETQIDPYIWGEPEWKYQRDFSGRIHVEQCAKQGATYEFTIEFVFWNWNEVP